MTKNKKLKPEYAEALLIYATTTEKLKSITDRLGLRYNTVNNYMRRNYPMVSAQHNALLPRDEDRFAEGVEMLRKGNVSPYQVKEELGYGTRFVRYIQTNFPEFSRQRSVRNRTIKRFSKVRKYAEAVEMLKEMKSRRYNVIKKVAEETGMNYDSLRMHIYTYHRELIGLAPCKNMKDSVPRSASKYAEAISRLASEPKQPANLIQYVADTLGLGYHALRMYIYDHHPELAQKKRRSVVVPPL